MSTVPEIERAIGKLPEPDLTGSPSGSWNATMEIGIANWMKMPLREYSISSSEKQKPPARMQRCGIGRERSRDLRDNP